MGKRIIRWALVVSVALWGGAACGGGGTSVASIEITNCPSTLYPGQSQGFTVVAKDAGGNAITGVTFTFDSTNPRFASVDGAGVLTALYPGLAVLTASSSGITSGPCDVTVLPHANSGTVSDLSDSPADNNVDDNWGLNNLWKMSSRGRVFWQRGNTTVLLHDLSDPVGTNTTIKSGILGGVDFMALGSGAGASDIMGSWRENNTNTFVTSGSGSPTALGPKEQEENSIDAGCFFFRMNTVQDILRFTFADGLTTAASAGTLGNPISSNCQAVWLEAVGGGDSDLLYFDGSSTMTVATLPFPARFDFRNGRVVYSLNQDIFLYDATAASPGSVNITNRPADLNNFVKTDGDSILFTRDVNGVGDHEVVLYDISSGTPAVISTTNSPKEGLSLDIDARQAVWREATTLYFHNGDGTPAGTSVVPLGATVLSFDKAYVSQGVVAWIAKDGADDDVYVMR